MSATLEMPHGWGIFPVGQADGEHRGIAVGRLRPTIHTTATSAVKTAAAIIRVFRSVRIRAYCSSAAWYEIFVASRNAARRRHSSVTVPLPSAVLPTPESAAA